MNSSPQRPGETVLELDLRALPPPQPLVQALAAVDTMAPGTVLRILTPLLPLPLLEALTARGLTHRIVPQKGHGACVMVEWTDHGATGD
jgi:Uncharacterized conserved protein (DUF2249)